MGRGGEKRRGEGRRGEGRGGEGRRSDMVNVEGKRKTRPENEIGEEVKWRGEG